MQTPSWWQHRNMTALALSPFGWLYGLGTFMRQRAMHPWTAPVPVICVGNITAGGNGKTPVTLDILERLPGAHALLRGYGGKLKGPVQVNRQHHTCDETGDEALLLAEKAPTWVARDRTAGAQAACEAGARYIVMDDGLQNPSLTKTLSLVVIDGQYGFGNNLMIPAGPLREIPRQAWKRADGIVLLGEDRTGIIDTAPAHLPVLRGRLVPDNKDQTWSGQRVIAFAGIGRPGKFFDALTTLGAELVATYSFADHHPYSRSKISRMLEHARLEHCQLVTTTKDAVRIDPLQRSALSVLSVHVEWNDHGEALGALLEPLTR
ncbi:MULTISPECIES: tetraacyldisaccharide 4'-kinase [unclassified Haematospirillum]|uniref:tetraacyldisaccharide 4'-kinase n=1 Tax=unclassified Haematospirillum TaxID=2622088 RepID=UPI00143C1D84|nr:MULTISPECIES: tetraacyldisaccharide 4'-kinase [unclassified Haematospirillum]NKD54613.1 tetraacyldisaccharide 4'-kinase [Haematospirillum sp. H4890]NKD74775.1 tetraacyldisaccharide 4'-kinase [Haematospirillum sp. H4485]NKD87986.1 tetraacyldisaccharide 4'-kinase [Haematospirillum sp. 15-248]